MNTHFDQFQVCFEQMTASSFRTKGWEGWHGRLGHTLGAGCWGPRQNLPGKEYLQVDLSKVKEISKVATQGSYKYNFWTTAFKLEYSADGKIWKFHNEVIA